MSDFSKDDINVVNSTLFERFKKQIEVEIADTETRLDPDTPRQLIADQVAFGSGYNRNAARLILAEVEREHGSEFVDKLIVEFDLETVFFLKPGTRFKT